MGRSVAKGYIFFFVNVDRCMYNFLLKVDRLQRPLRFLSFDLEGVLTEASRSVKTV